MNYDFNMKKQLAIFTVAAALLASCEKDQKISTEPGKNNTDNTVTQQTAEPVRNALSVQDSMTQAQQKIQFASMIFPKAKKDSAMAAFNEKYSEEERYKILALNRLDSINKWRADTLVIPSNLESDIMSFSPFPLQVDSLREVEKLAMFSYDIHAYALY